MYRFDPSSELFHEEMRNARALRGLTQHDVAEGVGISHTMVTRYEAAPTSSYKARPNPNTVAKIRKFFGAVGNADDNDGSTNEMEGLLYREEPLTIQEAKIRLAQTFGVTPENVKISIEA